MRVWFFLLALLVLLPLLDAQKASKNKKGKNKNQDKQAQGDGDSDEKGDMGEEESEDVLQLPRNTMLMEDNDVEMGRMHRMHSGDAGCRVSCKGSVSGMTRDDPRYPYYRYVKVDVTDCYDQNTVYPPDFSTNHHDWSQWNATVTKLQFYRIKDSNVRQLPKRLSFPTEVQDSNMKCGLEGMEGCYPTQRYFGFAVFIPRMDMQVKWRVDWEMHARSPYVNMDEGNMGHWSYGDCDGEVEEYMEDTRYQQDAFSISRDDGFSYWNPVNNRDEDNDRDQQDENY